MWQIRHSGSAQKPAEIDKTHVIAIVYDLESDESAPRAYTKRYYQDGTVAAQWRLPWAA
jgi:hypothetical protein